MGIVPSIDTNSGKAVFSDKDTALRIHYSGFPVFSLDENVKPHLLGSEAEIKQCTDKYCVPTDELNRFLRHDDREKTAEEQLEEKPNEESRKQTVFSEISLLTGISLNQLQALPRDVKEEILVKYSDDIGTVRESELAKEINGIIDGKPDNPLKSLEEQIEGNANSIDGIINNLPTDEEGKRSVFATIDVIKREYSKDGQEERQEEKERQH